MRRLGSIRGLGILAILAAMALPCLAGEIAVLKNGFQIRHERREIVGDVTRLYVNADGSSFVDVPTAQVDHFEAAADLPAATSPVPSAQPTNSSFVPSAFAKTATRSNPAPAKVDITEVVKDASGRYKLDPDLVNSVIKAESGFNSRAISPKGARGLMQLMPGTASQLGVPNSFDPRANVDGGTKYLRELLEQYNFDLRKALAAYNAGPQRVTQFGGIPPYYETRAYVARIVKDFNKKKLAEQKEAAAAKKSTMKSASSVKAAAKKNPSQTTAQAQPAQSGH